MTDDKWSILKCLYTVKSFKRDRFNIGLNVPSDFGLRNMCETNVCVMVRLVLKHDNMFALLMCCLMRYLLLFFSVG